MVKQAIEKMFDTLYTKHFSFIANKTLLATFDLVAISREHT